MAATWAYEYGGRGAGKTYEANTEDVECTVLASKVNGVWRNEVIVLKSTGKVFCLPENCGELLSMKPKMSVEDWMLNQMRPEEVYDDRFMAMAMAMKAIGLAADPNQS